MGERAPCRRQRRPTAWAVQSFTKSLPAQAVDCLQASVGVCRRRLEVGSHSGLQRAPRMPPNVDRGVVHSC